MPVTDGADELEAVRPFEMEKGAVVGHVIGAKKKCHSCAAAGTFEMAEKAAVRRVCEGEESQ